MDYIIAESRYRRRKYVEATAVCDTLLSKNSKDEVQIHRLSTHKSSSVYA